MTNKKTSDAQLRANRNWEEKNKEKNRIDTYRRNARTFVRNHATEEDMFELMEIFKNENGNKNKN